MAVFTKLESGSWPAIAAEVLLIFLGITLALWFDNMNEDRQDRRREARLLENVAVALHSDMRDLRGNLREDSLTLRSIHVVLSALERGDPYHDSLDQHFAQAAGWTTFIANTAAYEHLKVAGPALIADEDLRFRITDYHEHLLRVTKAIENHLVDPLWLEHMNPVMLRAFRYSERKQPATPVDYAALVENTEYSNILRHTGFAVEYKDRFYRRLLASADSTVRMIHDHVGFERLPARNGN